jgi:hypothetical protein
MLSGDDRRALRRVIVERAQLAGEDGQPLGDEDAEDVAAWLQQHVELEAESARTLALAREGRLYAEDLAELARELQFDEGLLGAIASEASEEVLAEAVRRALEIDMACEGCAQLASTFTPQLAGARLRALAIDVLGHVHAPMQEEDELMGRLKRLWKELDEAGRLRVLSEAATQYRLAGRARDDDALVHLWFYSHLSAPMRTAVAWLADRGWSGGAAQMTRAIEALRPVEPLTAIAQRRRIANMFRAAHARLAQDEQLDDIQEFVSVRGSRLVVDERWRGPITQLLRIERGQLDALS